MQEHLLNEPLDLDSGGLTPELLAMMGRVAQHWLRIGGEEGISYVDDVVQSSLEVAVKLYRHNKPVTPATLLAITKHNAYHQIRRLVLEGKYRAGEPDAMPSNLLDDSDQEESFPELYEPYHVMPIGNRIDISRAMASLSPKQRRVTELYYLDGYTVVEIAEQLGTSQPAVTKMLSRAVQAMRDWANH